MARKRQNLTVFVDSSVLFSAVCSVTGGSAKIFTLTNLHLVVSKVVLTEVERNVREKLESYHLERFFLMVEKLEILNQLPNEKLITRARKIIVEKDAVILAEAKQAKVNVLVTLDQKHILTKNSRKFISPTKIYTPRELILEDFGEVV